MSKYVVGDRVMTEREFDNFNRRAHGEPILCGSEFEIFKCELDAGHDGKHGAVLGCDEDGKVDEAVSWSDDK